MEHRTEHPDHADKTPKESPQETAPAAFERPRHWVDLQELSPEYWSDAKAVERRGQEFHDKPIETLDLIEKMDSKGLARREFLTVMGASMALAGTACVRKPVHKIIPYVVKPEYIVPGVANWYASTCQECATGCGILTKNREGRPIKLEGNPDHPVNQGTLCARGQVSILGLYDPDRLKGPLAVDRASGVRRTLGWDELDGEVAKRLGAIAAKGGKVRVLCGHLGSDTTRRLIGDFLANFKDGALVEYEPLSHEEVAEGQTESYGAYVVPTYHFDKAEVIVSFGADFLGEWVSPLEHAAAWAKRRKLFGARTDQASLSKFFCFESTVSVTGANADERFPLRPGDELKVALAIAHELVVGQKRSKYAVDSSVLTVLRGYSPEAVAAEIGDGVTVASIKRVAEALWAARGKGLVVAGGLAAKTQDSVALQVAANFLNSIAENEGATVHGSSSVPGRKSGFAEVRKLVQEMSSGAIDALIVYHNNAVYHLPPALGFEAAMKKVPLVLSSSLYLDETGRASDFVLAENHSLESWGDAHPRAEVYSLQQPAISPLHGTRSFQDGLLGWIKRLGGKGGLAGRIVAGESGGTFYDYLKENWKEAVHPKHGKIFATFNEFWESSLEKGVVAGGKPAASRREFRSAAFRAVPAYKKAPEGLRLALYPQVKMGDGAAANNAWLQEMPDPVTTITWDNFLNVAPKTAARLGLRQNDVVEIAAGHHTAELSVHLQPGMHPDAVSAAIGYGRTSAGNVGSGVGTNVYPFATLQGERLEVSGASVTLKKTGKRYELAETQGHHRTENRPIINDITLAEYRKSPASENHTDPHLRMKEVPTLWPKHQYNGPNRWGMTIDLNSCTGCGACVMACQAENNVPVVGRAQVRMSREMHWIRIDRYYSGSEDNPQVVFQPMLCQHCENAPCETVCPVLATVHNDEGLNEMVYNRCVGTRYCQNNCPYKVRRFNFFDNWKKYQDSQNMVWNPDITVRTRGVMEKCTFCVQRIQEAKGRAKDRGEIVVKDGEMKTACQQTCPTQAITFGNINDPKSRVSVEQADPRAYRVLEIQNTKPMVSYLTKVRNREPVVAHHDAHAEGKSDGHH